MAWSGSPHLYDELCLIQLFKHFQQNWWWQFRHVWLKTKKNSKTQSKRSYCVTNHVWTSTIFFNVNTTIRTRFRVSWDVRLCGWVIRFPFFQKSTRYGSMHFVVASQTKLATTFTRSRCACTVVQIDYVIASWWFAPVQILFTLKDKTGHVVNHFGRNASALYTLTKLLQIKRLYFSMTFGSTTRRFTVASSTIMLHSVSGHGIDCSP